MFELQSGAPVTLIELFGGPGAGKTTLTKAVAERADVALRADVSGSWWRSSSMRRLTHICRAAAQFHVLGIAIRVASEAPLRSFESRIGLCRLIAKSRWLRLQSGAVLLDQGFLQDIWSIFYASDVFTPEPRLLTALIRSLYAHIEAKIVFIDVPSVTAFERIRGRNHGHSRLDALPPIELEQSLHRAAQLPQRIVEAAEAAGLRVVRLDGSAPIDELARQLLGELPADSRHESSLDHAE